ncbi:CynX/NimT family MFS transporter [Paenibacillus sp. SI8]|uniref:MFS transporter n=1 Tax=unclassified Paenibacillus TaxID=185978 RepID=UPI003465FCFA
MMKAVGGGLLTIALFVAALNLRLPINSISPILESIQKSLGMNSSVASLLTAIPVLCMGIFSPIAAKLGARWGIERVLAVSLALIGIGTIFRFFTVSIFSLILTAFIAGAGIAAVGPLLSGFIKRYFPAKVPSMVAIYTMALTIGAALASGLSAPLQAGMGSWQGALAIWGVFAGIAVLIWMVVLQRIGKQAHLSAAVQTTKIPWGNPKAWFLTLSFGLLAMLFYAITAWLPPIIQSMGYSKVYAGNVLTVFAIVQIPAGMMLRALLKRFPSRLLWLITASIIELIGFLMIMFAIEPWIAAIFIGLGAGTLFSLNLLLPIDMTSSAQEAASWAAMTQSVGYIIGATGPIILGWIHDATHSFSLAIIGMIVINVVMIGVQIFAIPRQSKEKVELSV